MRRIDSAAQTPTLSIVHEAPVSFTQREFRGIMTRYNADNTTCPLFDRDLLGSIDPCQPSWIDYLVSDLTEAENHQLFGMVARSKVPQGTASMYRTAIEETLVFAFNRRGFLLDPIESMRVCAYFIRQAHCDQAKIEQLMPLWRCAGLWCTSMLREASDEVGDGEGQVVRAEAAAKELRFKRWNNVASGMISVLSQQCHEPAVVVAKVRCAWSLVSEWHRTWTAVMMALCPTERREFAAGIDKYAFPYWRPKLPGRFRLNELTLSTKSVNRLLVFLVRAGHVRDAVALLGFATSEAGVAIDCSLFNILLHGLVNPASVVAVHERDGRRFRLSSLSGLPLVNAHAPALYAASGSGEPPLGTSDDETLRTMQALLRGMVRWRLVPDSVTLDALVLFCCRTQNAALLDVVLRLFSGKWHTEPSESMLQKIREHGLGGVLAASPENKEH
ncbi:hypothetical protein GGI04_003479 [Coemansia thaxteri]|nr:hypothetical protein GGI04_003479 [Coemansia thaxteri]